MSESTMSNEEIAEGIRQTAELQLELNAVAALELMDSFKFDHLPEHLQDVSKPFCELAQSVVAEKVLIPNELVAGLRKLLEAKDCVVRAHLKSKKKSG